MQKCKNAKMQKYLLLKPESTSVVKFNTVENDSAYGWKNGKNSFTKTRKYMRSKIYYSFY
jgi:hypothetical protein